MIKYPKITIVTPSFNRAEYLEETILSVINQKYPNLEYIIVDGGSSDGTVDIIKKYESHLAWWTSEPDKGMYYAIQKGFAKATGEIMAWLNSDDKYHPGALEIVANIFTDLDKVEWIIGMPAFYNKDGLCVKINQNRKWSKSRFWIGDYRWIQQENVFWRRSLWGKAGSHMKCSYKYAGDFELWCRFFNLAELYSVSTSLSGFRLHGNQLSLKYVDIYEEEVQKILKSFKPGSSDLKRYNKIKHLWNWTNYMMRLNFKPANVFIIILTHLVDKMHNFPPYIYYDFKENKWKN